MEAIRIIKKHAKRRITITVPETFENKDLEITILPIKKTKPPEFNPLTYLGFMKYIDMDPRHEINKLREEWDRGF